LLFYPILDYDFTMTQKLLNLLKRDLKKRSINSFSKEINIPYATFYRLVHGQSEGKIKNWEKIEKYYRAKH